MACLEVTIKIMPEGPKTDLEPIVSAAKKEIELFGGRFRQHTIEEVAFGIKAIIVFFSLDESKGATDPLEERIAKIPQVNSVEVTHITRALG